MAGVLSGSFRTYGYDSGDASPDYFTFSWTATQNIAENKSVISWSVILDGGSSGYHQEVFSREVRINSILEGYDGVPNEQS